jgi:3-deoxy-manno-octulosonate cytidylyltransferase (CMP-KDO synthetase)
MDGHLDSAAHSKATILRFSEATAGRKPRGIVAIPARVGSTRLPNKLLLAETGRPLLAHVIECVKAAVAQSGGMLMETIVAVDDERLRRIADECGVRGVMTSADHRCGTTRIAEAIEKAGYNADLDFVVNVQGDEPELDSRAIVQVADELIRDPAADMSTLVIPMPAGTEASKQNPNAVKAILDDRGRAIYFSRAPIPFDRNPVKAGEALWHHHLGIYAYRRQFLIEFAGLPPCPLEEREALEQLRALHAGKGIKVGCIPQEWAGKGIDTRDDYEAFVQRVRHAA